MQQALNRISGWVDAGEPMLVIVAGALVALCFIVFSTLRLLLYLPQLGTCWNDAHGCSAINLFTWSSWIVSNASTGLYMWIFQNDALGLVFFLGNASMCAATVGITVIKRRRFAASRESGAETGASGPVCHADLRMADRAPNHRPLI